MVVRWWCYVTLFGGGARLTVFSGGLLLDVIFAGCRFFNYFIFYPIVLNGQPRSDSHRVIYLFIYTGYLHRVFFVVIEW